MHLFCDPDISQQRAMGLKVGEEMVSHAMTLARETGDVFSNVHEAEVRKQFAAREAVWLDRLDRFKPNDITIVFVCGADHVDTFNVRLDAKKVLASVHCRDWTESERA